MNMNLRNEFLMEENGGFRQLGWGRLVTKFMIQTTTIKLFKDFSFYGKQAMDGVEEGFIFTSGNSPKIINYISRDFFTIRRTPIHEAPNYSPALIAALGRNGLYVNDVHVPPNQSKILRSFDMIKLTEGICLFQFIDDRNFMTTIIPEKFLSKYHVDKFIGKGGQSTVRLLHILDSQEKVAMKITSKKCFNKESNQSYEKRIQHMIDEVNTMKKLHHVNVIKFIETVQTKNNLFIVMELAENGNLLEYMQTWPNSFLPIHEAKYCLYQVCKGLDYIHKNKIAHRDIKIDNIFVKKVKVNNQRDDNILKIGDFGYAKCIDQVLLTQLGTACYLPPEILNHQNQPYTLAADIWTLGCLFFACLSGAFPFHESYGQPVSRQIETANLSFERQEQWIYISENVKHLIKSMIQVVPERRPTVNQILFADWFKDETLLDRVLFIYGRSVYDILNYHKLAQMSRLEKRRRIN